MTKPNHEAIAAANLLRQQFDYYYPRLLIKIPNKKPVIRPLFPRYVFVHIGQIWRSLSGTRGISNLLMGSNGPQTVADLIIEQLQARHGPGGYYQLAVSPQSKFKHGDKVRATDGPFTGCLMLYDGQLPHERVACLFEAMGRQSRVELAMRSLVAA